jgi:hypothetical protein
MPIAVHGISDESAFQRDLEENMHRWRFKLTVSAGILAAVMCVSGCAKAGLVLRVLEEKVPTFGSEVDDAARLTKLSTWVDDQLAKAADAARGAKAARDSVMHDPEVGPLLQQLCGAMVAAKLGLPVDLQGRFQSLRNAIQIGEAAEFAEDVEAVATTLQDYNDGKIDKAQAEGAAIVFTKVYCS